MPSIIDPAADMAPPRVFLWHWGRAGAGAKFTAELARGLRTLGGVELLLSAARGSELHERALLLGLETYCIRTFSAGKTTITGRAQATLAALGLPGLIVSLARCLRRRQIDLALCAMQSIWDAAMLPALRTSPARSLLVLHDAFFHPGEDYYLRRAVLRRQILATDGLIVLSNHVREQVIESFGYPPNRIWKAEHGAFSFPGGPAGPHRRVPGRPLRLVFLGRILAYKGLGLLLQAYRLLRAASSEIELVIAGSGSLGPYQSLLRGAAGIEIRNRWLAETEIGEILAEADILVLPYVEASQSGVAAAAAAAGLPVVATPVGGLAEQVEHGVTGLVAPAVSPDSLAETIRTLGEDPVLYDHCAHGAFARARDRLGWEETARVVRRAIQELRASPPRRKACDVRKADRPSAAAAAR